MFKKLLAAAAVVALSGGAASAVQVGTLGTLGTGFTPGTGNSNTNFVVNVNDIEDVEVGVKAKERFVGELPFQDGVGYQALAGESGPGLPIWNVDFSIDFGSSTIDNFLVFLILDFDPAINSTPASLALHTNPLLTGLSVVQGSQNLGFGFFQTLGDPNIQPIDPFAPGVYELGIQVFDLNSDLVVEASTAVNVSAVPLPAALPMFALGLGGLFLYGRRRRAAA